MAEYNNDTQGLALFISIIILIIISFFIPFLWLLVIYMIVKWILDIIVKSHEKKEKEQQALKLLTYEAKQGNAKAQNNLGFRYCKGQGVPQDDPQAVYWWKQSAEQGNENAKQKLRLRYRKRERYLFYIIVIGVIPVLIIYGFLFL